VHKATPGTRMCSVNTSCVPGATVITKACVLKSFCVGDKNASNVQYWDNSCTVFNMDSERVL
jgi:hypothetical protein